MIKKEQEIDWKVGGTFVYKKSNYDHCQIVKILKVGEYLIECENLEGVKYTLLNCQINFKPLWFSEDFYLNLGLLPCEENIFKNLDLNYCYYNLFESQRVNNNFYLFSILKNEKNENIQKHFIIKKDKLENLQDIINNDSIFSYITFKELFRNLLNENFKIEFPKKLDLDIQYNPIHYQPKYKWSK